LNYENLKEAQILHACFGSRCRIERYGEIRTACMLNLILQAGKADSRGRVRSLSGLWVRPDL
jgi:hypothetical protein